MVVKLKILVTGADGQVGMELRELSSGYPQFEFIFTTRAELPLENEDQLREKLANYHPQYFIHCAAYTAVDKAESDADTAFTVNAVAPGIIAEYCKENAIQLFHLSTDYVFDGTATVPYTEADITNPVTVYGASKLAGEVRVQEAAPDAMIIRTSWVYSSYGKNFVKTMLRLMAERPEISVVNDQVGSPTYAADIAALIMGVIVSQEWHPGIYNFSNEGIISWFDFATEIKRLTASPCMVNPIPSSAYPVPAKRPAWSVLDKSKVKDVLGIDVGEWEQRLEECLKKISAGPPA